MTAPMIQVIKDGGVEQFEKPMPSHYWLRNKKQSVHYIHDTPFATERQLEDQRLLMQKNRNPQYLVPTKVDKVRSQTISATIGASRPEAVKANVLNKIVREASGIHNYTIVAPVKSKDSKPTFEKLEPETNPRVRPYAKEAKMKPVLCSFGHRPRSASRTFHPATMRFRLKHGEIAQGGDNVYKTGFGLPVSVLAQVLKAPKLYHPHDNALFGEESSAEFNAEDSVQRSRSRSPTQDDTDAQQPAEAGGEDLQHLFFTESEHNKMFRPVQQAKDKHKVKKHSNSNIASGTGGTGSHAAASHARGLEEGSSLERPSWVSSVERADAKMASSDHGHQSPKAPAIVYPELEKVRLCPTLSAC